MPVRQAHFTHVRESCAPARDAVLPGSMSTEVSGGGMRQLFISYARENRPDVEALVHDLHSLGYDTWLDTSLRGGQTWWHEILQRIADSDVFVAIISGNTLRSVACKRELEWALALNKPVLPLAVEQLPDALPRTLSMRQIVDYSQSCREAALALAGALWTLPPAPPPPEQLPEPPAAPLSYLSDLVDQVGQTEPLTQHQQHQILIQLEPALRSSDTEERRGGRYVLEMFSRRGDLYADVDRTVGHMLETARETREQPATVGTDEPASTPEAAVAARGNLLADAQWADALSAFFAKRWAEAVQRFEALQACYPDEGRVETRLKEARRQWDIDIWAGAADAAAADGDWDAEVAALENLTKVDPDRTDIGARLEYARTAQRHKTLVDEIGALHQAGEWHAVVAAAHELERIAPHDADPNGIVSDARAKIRDAELADRYAQALNHLDQGQWQQAADMLAAIDREQPGYRDTAPLLGAARQRLRERTEVDRSATPSPLGATPPAVPGPVGPEARAAGRRLVVGAVVGVALVAGLVTIAVAQSSKPSQTPTTSTSVATTSAPPVSVQRSGPNETIADYVENNNIHMTTITPGTPGTPTFDFPVPDGWTRIRENDPDQYFGIFFNTPADLGDPPKITATVKKLTGNVDPNKLLDIASGEVKNQTGYNGSDKRSMLSGYPSSQLGGSYAKNGVTRMIAQNTVVTDKKDGVYVVQILAEGAAADTDALKAATGVIVQKTTITP
ncbi:LpqN/LpqT family lipoprotein [Mycolicibacterium conceptionense]|uniref:LpqN/LpqT family lipoprotein n=1 Tax=Mycolicibacterium conceptionense TaxID=451644 RepID=UPI0009D69CC5|nr:LpqN/LpqT family lipoprotein [Mycolicibacterium conceptionense]